MGGEIIALENLEKSGNFVGLEESENRTFTLGEDFVEFLSAWEIFILINF